MDYLEATLPRFASVLLNGHELRVVRAPLGLHYRLSEIMDRWQDARNASDQVKAAELTFSYVALATGLEDKEVRQASLIEVLASFLLLVNLNRASGVLPFMSTDHPKEEHDYDYKNRGLANWVTILAGQYGWTPQYILEELSPEEAMCYLQEALLQKHGDREFLYRLSEMAYTIEGKGKNARSRYVPFPKEPWMAKKMPKILVPKTWLPQGQVIDASNLGRARV